MQKRSKVSQQLVESSSVQQAMNFVRGPWRQYIHELPPRPPLPTSHLPPPAAEQRFLVVALLSPLRFSIVPPSALQRSTPKVTAKDLDTFRHLPVRRTERHAWETSSPARTTFPTSFVLACHTHTIHVRRASYRCGLNIATDWSGGQQRPRRNLSSFAWRGRTLDVLRTPRFRVLVTMH
nr:hypothetical protein CFP56_12314 [Quercus suber]